MANASIACASITQRPDTQRTEFTGLLGWASADSGQLCLEGAWKPPPRVSLPPGCSRLPSLRGKPMTWGVACISQFCELL